MFEDEMLFRRDTEGWRVPIETLETHATTSLSSTEADAKAIRTGCVEGSCAKNLLEELTGETHNLDFWTDSWSAGAISQRLEPRRRAKHLDVQTKWVQQMPKQDILKAHKVAGEANASDVLTTHVPRAVLRAVLDKLSGSLEYWKK